MPKALDFSDLGATPVAAAPLDFSDLGGEKVGHEDVSKMESLGRGVQQGATLGFGDEFSGGVEATADATQQLLNKLGMAGPSPTQVNSKLASEGVKGDLGPKELLDMYRQGRDSNRLENTAAQEANPMTYLGGNIAGGVLPAMAAPQALMNPLGSAAKSAPLLQKMAQGAVNAVPAAAVVGAGTSNAEMTPDKMTDQSATNFGNDVLNSAEMGAGFGAAVPLAAEPVKAAGKTVKNSKMAQDLLDSYRAGINKIDLHTPEFLKNSRDQLKNIAGEVDDAYRATTQKLFNDKGNVLKELDKNGATGDTKEALAGLEELTSSPAMKPEDQKLIKAVNNQIIGKKGWNQNASTLESTIKDLKDLKGSVSGQGYAALDSTVKKLQAVQNAMDPRIQEINNKLFQVVDSSEAMMNRGALEYGTGAQDLNTKEKLASLFENSTPDKYRTQSTLDDVINNGLETNKNVPISPMKDLVPDAAKNITENVPDIARNMQLAKGMQGPSFRGANMVDSTVNAIKSSGTKLANSAGRTISNNKEFLQRGIQGLSDASPDQLKQLSGKLVEVGGKAGQEFARVLAGAEGKNNVSKNAIMFGLMQKPEFRELFHKANGDADNVEPGQ